MRSLNSPVSPGGLFGPAIEGFAEHVTAAQKSSQALQHFLPKHFNSAAVPSHHKPVPTQHPAKPAPPAACSVSKSKPRQCSRSTKRYPFPKYQNPWPKVALDLVPQVSS